MFRIEKPVPAIKSHLSEFLSLKMKCFARSLLIVAFWLLIGTFCLLLFARYFTACYFLPVTFCCLLFARYFIYVNIFARC